METYLTVTPNYQNISRILHITDTHLFGMEEGELLGINSYKSFLAVIEEIEKKHQDIDLIVATGDLVQDRSKKGYEQFAKHILKLRAPCVWLAGNHDVYSVMQSTFANYKLPQNKAVYLGKHWMIILLNSQVSGKPYGFLVQSELDFINHIISQNPDRSVLIFLHHNPIASGCEWLDKHALTNSNDLAEIILFYPQIKGLGWGHIHQEQDEFWLERHVFSTPSTCIQFKQNCCQFELSKTDSPGWREIILTPEGNIETFVHRIAHQLFLPDTSQVGYE